MDEVKSEDGDSRVPGVVQFPTLNDPRSKSKYNPISRLFFW